MLVSRFRRALPGLLTVALAICCAGTADAQNWTRFRGDKGRGVSDLKGVPTTWGADDYAWNVELPGEGHSSAAIWGDRLFVTSAVDEGSVRYLICLSAYTGEEIWTRAAGFNKSHKHAKSSWASCTPAVDGQRVYVSFADTEHYRVAAYDFDGTLLWRRCLGPFESQHNLGASPIVFENLVIVPNEQDGPSSIVALDAETGQTVWSVLRPAAVVSYATPFVMQRDGGQPQLVVSSNGAGVSSLDPLTGRQNWTTGPFASRTVASPVLTDGGLIVQVSGGGGTGTELIAVDPTGSGIISGTHIPYKRNRELPYVPTPIAYGDHVYLWGDNAVVSCIDAQDGTNLWTKRIPSGGNYSSSPLCIDGKLYAINEAGDVAVLAAEPEFKYFGTTSLGDPSHATPSVAGGRVYFRTIHRLACLEPRP